MARDGILFVLRLIHKCFRRKFLHIFGRDVWSLHICFRTDSFRALGWITHANVRNVFCATRYTYAANDGEKTDGCCSMQCFNENCTAEVSVYYNFWSFMLYSFVCSPHAWIYTDLRCTQDAMYRYYRYIWHVAEISVWFRVWLQSKAIRLVAWRSW